jgi:hypothetical protein
LTISKFLAITVSSFVVTAFAFIVTSKEVLTLLSKIRTKLQGFDDKVENDFDVVVRDTRRIGVPTASMFLFVVSGIHPGVSLAGLILWPFLILIAYKTGFLDERVREVLPPPVLQEKESEYELQPEEKEAL